MSQALVLGKYPTSYLWAMSTIALLLVPPLQPFPTCYICSTTNIFFVYNLFFTFCGSVIWAHLIRMATEWDLWRMLYRPSYNAAVCPITLLPFIVKIRKKPLYLDFPLSLSRQQLALIWDVDNVSQSDTWLSTLHCFAPSVFVIFIRSSVEVECFLTCFEGSWLSIIQGEILNEKLLLIIFSGTPFLTWLRVDNHITTK